ncbi:MAG TPA: MnhB domain-containing protein [Candidatus Baltobacteraceae bacterium]|jgi:multicomponent Na+:H+ antiporter subunit B|nr:MnhB domain-containing protein [Candidatus Baltobacteraceae bacterium]
MTLRGRTILYVCSAVLAFAVMMYGATGLPPFGSFSGAYTDLVLQITTAERHVYNVPTAINFDIRGFDTLGEEFIFFTSVAGVLFILSAVRGKTQTHPEPMESEPGIVRTGALRWFPTGLTAFIAAMAMDLAAHGQLTPGGGFQGGAVFGSALACVFLGVGMHAFLQTARKDLFDQFEALGAFAFGAVGVSAMWVTGYFLKNVLPLGQTGATVSGGTIYLINIAVFIEIASGFTVLTAVFLNQTRQTQELEE